MSTAVPQEGKKFRYPHGPQSESDYQNALYVRYRGCLQPLQSAEVPTCCLLGAPLPRVPLLLCTQVHCFSFLETKCLISDLSTSPRCTNTSTASTTGTQTLSLSLASQCIPSSISTTSAVSVPPSWSTQHHLLSCKISFIQQGRQVLGSVSKSGLTTQQT